MLRACRVLLQPTVFVNSLLLIDSTALQQTFTEECRAYLEEGGTLKLRLPEKNETNETNDKKKKIFQELEEKATIVRNDEGKFGLRWEKEGEEDCFDNDCVKQFVEEAAKDFLEKYELPGNDKAKYYSYVTYYPQGVCYPQGEKQPSLSSYISKARADAAAAAGGGRGHTRDYLAEGHGAGACALFSSLS